MRLTVRGARGNAAAGSAASRVREDAPLGKLIDVFGTAGKER
jgi:hypothetical protein